MHPQFITLPKKAKNITGQVFGRLTVIGPIENRNGRIMWLCRCECGETATPEGKALRVGHTKSCGCLQRDKVSAKGTTHGLHKHPLYGIWAHIVQRCTCSTNDSFHNYGGRGISICDEWRYDFKAFHDYVSQLPDYGTKGYQLDRIDNDGNYEPGNVRWADRYTQLNNTRRNTFVTFRGEIRTVGQWARTMGLPLKVVWDRLRNNWDIERALTTPHLTRSDLHKVANDNSDVPGKD